MRTGYPVHDLQPVKHHMSPEPRVAPGAPVELGRLSASIDQELEPAIELLGRPGRARSQSRAPMRFLAASS